MIREEIRTGRLPHGESWRDPAAAQAFQCDGDATPSGWAKARSTIESTIGKHPRLAFGAALVAGIAIGWWVKRR